MSPITRLLLMSMAVVLAVAGGIILTARHGDIPHNAAPVFFGAAAISALLAAKK